MITKTEFDNLDKPVKPEKYIPLLEKQVKTEMNKRKYAERKSRGLMKLCFDLKDKIYKLNEEINSLSWVIVILTLGLLTASLIIFLLCGGFK